MPEGLAEPAFDWDRLEREIRRQQVVPIIGPELLPYYRTLAEPLARGLELPEDAASVDIGAVADFEARRSGDARRAESQFAKLLEAEREVPEALRKLAAIREFRLFITTDYARLVEAAVREFDPAADCRTLTFSLGRRLEDLDAYPQTERCVYHLLGNSASGGRIGLARVDQLEFFYELQTAKGPRGLLSVLGECRNLLFLGCNFPEWLAGFFTRILIGRPLYDTRERGIEVIAHELGNGGQGSSLTAFLRANRVDVYPGDAVSFVEELTRRYRPPPLAVPSPLAAAAEGTWRRRVPGSAFVSYHHDDRETVRTLVRSLREKSVEVWFDESALTPGADFEGEIRLAIQEDSSAFIPVLSRKALERDESYFIKEWSWAEEALARRFRDVRFVFPVIIDDEDQASVLARLNSRFPAFAKVQLERCPEGQLNGSELVEQLRTARKNYERSARRAH